MKIHILLLALLLIGQTLVIAEPFVTGVDFQGTTIVKDERNQWVKRDRTVVAMARGKAAISVEGTAPAVLKVDASAADADGSGKELVLVRFLVPLDDHNYSGKKLTAKIQLTADRPSQGLIIIEGDAAGKHFFKQKEVQLDGKPAELSFSIVSEDAIDKVWVRFDALSPAVYQFSGATLQVEGDASAN